MRELSKSNTGKKDLLTHALIKAGIKYDTIRDDNICIISVNTNQGEMLVFSDKHCPLYEVVLNEFGNPKNNYETGIISKIINHIKKLI